MYDVLVLGSGVAGLSTAVRAANEGMSVLVLTKGELAHSATRFAQGGVAAALAEPDSPQLHLSDTLAAGAGLCDVDATRVLVSEGPARVRELVALGAVFDRMGTGDGTTLARAREGGHSLARVVHAGGDATGAEIERALVLAVHELALVEVREHAFAVDLVMRDARCRGVTAELTDGTREEISAMHTVLATGGAGQCYAVTTNPLVSTGDGTAMALRAGVAVADMEFMQFHPTALDRDAMPRPLLSEALRGDGAVLRDASGYAFMAAEHPLADLAPRDVVSRAIGRRLAESGERHVWLDTTSIADLESRFPTIWRSARAAGFDPHREWLPVAPAAHYLSGGVCTDLDGASVVAGLWACGETACSGVHGANRLASNSLLDGLVFAPRIVSAIARGKDAPESTGVLRGILDCGVAWGDARPTAVESDIERSDLQILMTRGVGVLRDAAGLTRALARLRPVAADDAGMVARRAGDGGMVARRAGDGGMVGHGEEAGGVTDHRTRAGIAARELANLVTVSRAIASAALAREESRGTHTRLDFPERDERFTGRLVHADVVGAPILVPLSVGVPEPSA